jgi:hypothetical protein
MPSPEAAPGLSADSFGPMATNSTLDSPCRRRAVAFPRVCSPTSRGSQFGKLCTTRASGSERVHLPQTPERMSGSQEGGD